MQSVQSTAAIFSSSLPICPIHIFKMLNRSNEMFSKPLPNMTSMIENEKTYLKWPQQEFDSLSY
jgi:hypothetical protein